MIFCRFFFEEGQFTAGKSRQKHGTECQDCHQAGKDFSVFQPFFSFSDVLAIAGSKVFKIAVQDAL